MPRRKVSFPSGSCRPIPCTATCSSPDDPRRHARREGARRRERRLRIAGRPQGKDEEDARRVSRKAIENVKPVVEVKSRRVGAATYQVPVEIRRNGASPFDPLAGRVRAGTRREDHGPAPPGELLDAYNNRGNDVKEKEDTHKMAEANKAFAHYRW